MCKEYFRSLLSICQRLAKRGHVVEKFKKEIPHYKVRHLVKSGITGWAQVNGWPGDTSIAKRVEHDMSYLENWSFWKEGNSYGDFYRFRVHRKI